MRYWGLAASALAIVLACLPARGADHDLMAMRGDSGDGTVRVNLFLPAWRAGLPAGGVTERHASVPGAASGNLIRPKPSRRTAGNSAGYLEWKNSCVFVMPSAGGEAPELDSASDFSRVAPYLARPATAGEGFLEQLIREFRIFP